MNCPKENAEFKILRNNKLRLQHVSENRRYKAPNSETEIMEKHACRLNYSQEFACFNFT